MPVLENDNMTIGERSLGPDDVIQIIQDRPTANREPLAFVAPVNTAVFVLRGRVLILNNHFLRFAATGNYLSIPVASA